MNNIDEKKTGADAPSREIVVATRSTSELRLTAATIPSGRAITSESANESPASCSVSGSRFMIRSRTSCRCR